ncbi:putative fructosyl amino acid protein [Thermochaetoides thermophila DSM 1495]|uniref:Putative fructosyl amino acid protein n=1 Tax=Chaetomium thermophilum (strain DSM 1495 / CBS 144.50 / IMI 039719) TaxID=759272 RepID=G0SAL5_CHATD|nr:putative fructosyl amino acid protein [Thermochaetoides thermophila DSM 1495]EGS19787.1 putative fructosyl amino acid protein [Thermochaetoides thermophila DSM 1495]
MPSFSKPFTPPSSVLIIGSGVFGLATALSLCRRDAFKDCSITVIDRSDPSQPGAYPAPDAASVDTNRIIRADYADPDYAALCDEAQAEWRKQEKPTDLGAQGRYNEVGLLLVADALSSTPTGAQECQDGHKPKLTGMDYVRESWANVTRLASKDPTLAARIKELPNPTAIRDALGTGGSSGDWGYLNLNSGWGNAGASMQWHYEKAQQTGRIKFVAGTVVSLEHNDTTVTGARLSDGTVLSADLVVVAAGAWTGGLVDLSGQAAATGQAVAYIDLTEEEQQKLSKMPVILNLTTGLFIFPPVNCVLKVARHAYGYLNPTIPVHPPLPLRPSSIPSSAPVSLPFTSANDPNLEIPAEGAADLRRALREMIPWPDLRDRPFTKTRICWYSDTPTGDFIVDYHPYWKGLFVATGDSGHAFKFLPVIGEKVADCIMGQCPPQFKEKWAWKIKDESQIMPALSVVTEDGSRGGVAGLILVEELAKSTTA